MQLESYHFDKSNYTNFHKKMNSMLMIVFILSPLSWAFLFHNCNLRIFITKVGGLSLVRLCGPQVVRKAAQQGQAQSDGITQSVSSPANGCGLSLAIGPAGGRDADHRNVDVRVGEASNA